jgi:hypothetical protein
LPFLSFHISFMFGVFLLFLREVDWVVMEGWCTHGSSAVGGAASLRHWPEVSSRHAATL